MFKRQWLWFGKLISDEGFELWYAQRSINYRDHRGTFQFALEDGILVPIPYQYAGEPITLNQSEIDQMVDRVVRGIMSQGRAVRVFSK
jgi:hypothetical protein